MRELDATLATFSSQLDQLLAWDLGVDSEIDVTVARIIDQVRSEGDEQLLTLTRKFDNDAQSPSELELASWRTLGIDWTCPHNKR